jgi:hypothetical protein
VIEEVHCSSTAALLQECTIRPKDRRGRSEIVANQSEYYPVAGPVRQFAYVDAGNDGRVGQLNLRITFLAEGSTVRGGLHDFDVVPVQPGYSGSARCPSRASIAEAPNIWA